MEVSRVSNEEGCTALCKDRQCNRNGYFGTVSDNVDCPYCGNSHALCCLVKPYCVCQRRSLVAGEMDELIKMKREYEYEQSTY